MLRPLIFATVSLAAWRSASRPVRRVPRLSRTVLAGTHAAGRHRSCPAVERRRSRRHRLIPRRSCHVGVGGSGAVCGVQSLPGAIGAHSRCAEPHLAQAHGTGVGVRTPGWPSESLPACSRRPPLHRTFVASCDMEARATPMRRSISCAGRATCPPNVGVVYPGEPQTQRGRHRNAGEGRRAGALVKGAYRERRRSPSSQADVDAEYELLLDLYLAHMAEGAWLAVATHANG